MDEESRPARATCDAFFGGRLMIRQPADGHRAGTDAVLLAAAVSHDFSGLAYDAGAGVGTAGLGLAFACPASRVGLIEVDPLNAALAWDNLRDNGLADRVRVFERDLLAAASELARTADLVVTNPPFYEPGSVRPSPDPRRRTAHVGAAGGTPAWIAACLALLKPHGILVAIHQPAALPVLLGALERRAGAIAILPVHTKGGAPAKRILLRAVVESRAGLTLLPGLVLNDADGPTPASTRISRGEASLDW